MTLARFDTWVRATMGPAVAGAQVYICTQPAATSTLPPSPLASLFSDNAGANSITQPLSCDGFGHAYAYLDAGTYTVVIVNGGLVQQVLPDQQVGAAQVLLNTEGDASLTIDNGMPADNIEELILSNNGIPAYTFGKDAENDFLIQDIANSSTVLERYASGLTDINSAGANPIRVNRGNASGTGMSFYKGTALPVATIDQNGIGTFSALIDSNGSVGTSGQVLTSTGVALKWGNNGVSFSTVGLGFFFGAQSFSSIDITNYTNELNTGTTVYAVQLNLAESYTVGKVAEYTVTAAGSGLFFTAGLYSADGNALLIDAGANAFQMSDHSQYATVVNLGSPVVIPPGTYWFAWGGGGTSGSVLCHDNAEWLVDLLNGYVFGTGFVLPVKFGSAANGLSGGALPATLGTITAIDHSDEPAIPAIAFLV